MRSTSVSGDPDPVSYTHLDVYKRQGERRPRRANPTRFAPTRRRRLRDSLRRPRARSPASRSPTANPARLCPRDSRGWSVNRRPRPRHGPRRRILKSAPLRRTNSRGTIGRAPLRRKRGRRSRIGNRISGRSPSRRRRPNRPRSRRLGPPKRPTPGNSCKEERGDTHLNSALRPARARETSCVLFFRFSGSTCAR